MMMKQSAETSMLTVPLLVRALRLPFTAASVLPYCAGALLFRGSFAPLSFILGLLAVACTHLSANLINDYADSRSGNDWVDPTYFGGIFGGSKLIQEGVVGELFTRNAAGVCAAVAALCVVVLTLIQRDIVILILFVAILLLAWSYSCPPLKLAYRRLGELFIFLLFGPIPALGGYYLQGGAVISLRPLLMSLIYGLLTTAILVANEVPDAVQDKAVGKRNWVGSIQPHNAWILYDLLMAGAAAILLLNVWAHILHAVALAGLLGFPLAMLAGEIVRHHYRDRQRLLASSKLTVGVQFLMGIAVLIGCFQS